LQRDAAFKKVDLVAATDPARFVGRAPEQVDEFMRDVVDPIRNRYPEGLEGEADLRV
jgi:adenylosuccinate lyase